MALMDCPLIVKKKYQFFYKIIHLRDFSLMVKHVTFNHYNMGSNPIGLNN